MKILIENRMKNVINLLLLTSLFLIGNVSELFATHAAGSDIRYRCLGGLQYEVEVTFYRDCGGVAEPNNITVNCKSGNGNGALNLTLTATKVSGTGGEITVPCTSTNSTCNGGSTTGIRKFVYVGVITLPSAQTDWTFSYSVCCRNCTITTINNPCASNSVLYVEAKLNNVLAPCNSAPNFSNIPIAFVCLGQNFNYNHGVIDPDGDSLAYQLITPKTSATSTVSFISPASATTPIASSTPFSLSATTGNLNFTPSQVQIGVLAILVKEYRNGQLIGSVIRDMQIYTTACTNTLPTASGINGTNNFSTTVCPGQQVCFTVNSADIDASQNVTVTTNNGITGATYTISGGSRPTLTFCWTPSIDDVDLNPKTFTVTVRDNACPSNGIQTYSYTLYVPSPYFTIASTNISCNGSTTGTATATPVYASSYTYSWNTTPPQTTSTISNLPAGTYSVVVTDISGCSATRTTTISQPGPINISNTNTNPNCVGICNGGVDISISGGSAPYTYAWSTGNTNQDISNVCAGNYTVTVTDANGCSNSKSFTLTNAATLTSVLTPTNINCFNTSTGSINQTINGSTPPLSYSWSNGTTTQNLTNVAAGTYSVTATDGNGCTVLGSATISQPSSAVSVSLTKIDATCFGLTNGSANSTVTGGVSPYTYSWSNGATTPNLSNVASGSYTLTVTDNNGCTKSATISISQPLASLATSTTNNNVLCFGLNTGSASATVSGGTTPYSYLWSNGNATNTISLLAAGTYTITATDANGCTSSASVNITQPTQALTATSTANTIDCFGGSNGIITTTVNGGTPPYQYSWNTGATTSGLTNVVAGTYSVTITDGNGCTTSTSKNITQPSAALSITSTKTDINCFGNNTGSISISVNGGTPGYTYNWNNGSTTQNLNNIPAGAYQVTATDTRGCTISSIINVTQPESALRTSSTSTNLLCFGVSTGVANINANGGTSPYTYLWSNGNTTNQITNLAAGTYSVTVTDINGCTNNSTIVISQPASAINSSITSTNLSCFQDNSGSATVIPTGGTSPYSVIWSNGIGATTNNNLTAGTYSVIATDANGCSISKSVTITQPSAALSSTKSTTDINCHGESTGSININPAGGTSPYTYLWNNNSTSQNLSNIPAGSYAVTITDANGCSIVSNSILQEPSAALSLSVTSNNISCHQGNDGSVSVTVSGGTSPYSFIWNTGSTSSSISNLNAGSYTVTVTDANNCKITQTQTLSQPSSNLNATSTSVDVSCNGVPVGSVDLSVSGGTSPYSYLWNNGSMQQDLTNLTAGNYEVTITDANGCTLQHSKSVSQPAGALNSSATLTHVSCHGLSDGTINLTTTAGTAPYTYLWNNNSTQEDLTNLTAGTYTVDIADANNCRITYTVFITQPAEVLSASATSTPLTCFENSTGSIDLTTVGGTQPYSYTWSNNSNTEDLSQIQAGNYSVNIVDANGCTTSTTVSVSQPSATLSVSASTTNLNCHDINDGAINITTSGGTTPYTYVWSNGFGTEDLTNLTPGSYSVTVTDNNNCVANGNYTISYTNNILTANISAVNVNCFGAATGSVALDVNGGELPYNYTWSNNSTDPQLTNVEAGNYTVVIHDVNGCTTNASISVIQPTAPLSMTNTSNPILCYGLNTGAIDISIQGGTAPYQYLWTNNSTDEDISGVIAGSYTVNVTDQNGCSLSQQFDILQPTAPLTIALTSDEPNCHGDSTGSISAIVSGGTPIYSLLWNNQASTADLTNVNAGTYSITATDNNGCIATETITINQPTAGLASTPTVTNIDCNGNGSGSANLNTSGGTAPYTYAWSNGSTTENIQGIVAGIYQYTITDSQQCEVTGSIEITQPTNALVVTNQVTNVDCHGLSSAAVDLTATGGTMPYTFIWSNGSTTEDISNLAAGSYSVTVTDANNCFANIAFAISEPTLPLTMSETITNVNCFGESTGTINLSITGGTAPYQVSWNNGSQDSTLTNLVAGNYQALVTDANGCTTNNSFSINEPVAVLASSVTSTIVTCFGLNNGTINTTISGGTQPYTYNWSNGQTSQNISGLGAGDYTVTITDANNCSVNLTTTVNEPSPALDLTYFVQDVLCFGDNSGSINAIALGGTPPYSYAWSNGSTNSNINNLTNGQYTLTVTDANGCTKSLPVSVSQPTSLIQLSMSTNSIMCNGNNDGWIDLSVVGGMGNYSYQWNNGGTIQDPQNLSPGNYTVVVTDQNGCTATNSTTITQPSASLNVNASTQNVTCTGLQNGIIDLNIQGGTGSYTYVWSNNANTQSLNGLAPGSYSVTVTDANGCSQQYATTITEPSNPITASANTKDADCLTGIQGSISIDVDGGTTPYNFIWSHGGTTQNMNGLQPGNYTVQVIDAMGCELTKTFTIIERAQLTIRSLGDVTVCMGTLVTLTTDTLPGVSLQWNFNGTPLLGATSNTFITPAGGIFSLTATSSCGVFNSNPIEVTFRALNSVSINNNVIICPGETVQLTAGGGVEYTWTPSTGLNLDNVYNPIASPTKTTEYTVSVKDEYGCKATASVTVAVVCDTLDIPNGYSPNGDGTNDTFEIDGLSNYPGNILYIYNRWGNLIYKQKDYQNDWNGRSNVSGAMFGSELTNGTYFYILDLNIGEKPLNGFVVIRR